MYLEPFLLEHPDVDGILTKFPGLMPTYLVSLGAAGRIKVPHVPAKALVNTFLLWYEFSGYDSDSNPWVFVAGTRWHERGLVRQRVDQGIREAKYQLMNRKVPDIRSAAR